MSLAPNREVTSPSRKPNPAVMGALRALYVEIPEIRMALSSPSMRKRVHDLLLPLTGTGTRHSQEDCIARLFGAGYYVSRTAPTYRRTRTNDHETSIQGGASAAFRADSQKARLLAAYAAAGATGLTAIEACRAARLSEKSCYWKRVSELREIGMIENAEDAHGAAVVRPGDYGVEREVYVITPLGEARLTTLE